MGKTQSRPHNSDDAAGRVVLSFEDEIHTQGSDWSGFGDAVSVSLPDSGFKGDHTLAITCPTCGLAPRRDAVHAMGSWWHSSCFRCHGCNCRLSDTYYVWQGQAFCETDFYERAAEICVKCGDPVDAAFVDARHGLYHHSCFKCDSCGEPIEENEAFGLGSSQELTCMRCFEGTAAKESMPSFGSGGQVFRIELPAAYLQDHDILVSEDYQESDGRRRIFVTSVLFSGIKPRDSDWQPIQRGDEIVSINDDSVDGYALFEIKEQVGNGRSLGLQLVLSRPVEAPHVISPRKRSSSRRRRSRFSRLKQGSSPSPARTSRQRTATLSSSLLMSKALQLRGRLVRRPSEVGDIVAELQTPPPDTDRVRRPTKLEDLELGDVIGKGFFGSVRKAKLTGTDMFVVVKELHDPNKHARRTFLKEACLLKALKHENVLRFAGLFSRDGQLYLCTEYVDRGTLNETISDDGRTFAWPLRVAIARDIARGMAYLHGLSIIHRDLTSHNCLLRSSGHAVVADFGLARVINAPETEEQASSERTSRSPHPFSRTSSGVSHDSGLLSPFSVSRKTPDGMDKDMAGSGDLDRHSHLRRTGKRLIRRMSIVGSPFWMSPEMMLGRPYDQQTDVFSFGIILCELLTRLSADPDIMPRTMAFTVDWPELEKHVPEDRDESLYDAAVSCTELNPEHRPSFGDLVDGLQ